MSAVSTEHAVDYSIGVNASPRSYERVSACRVPGT